MRGEAFEYADALVDGRPRGRGAGLNPGNRHEAVRLHVLGEHLDHRARDGEGPPRVATQVIPERTRTIINRVDPEASPDICFRWSVNPYRGCEHGCVYCFARPDHERLGMSSGLDFETKIVVKRDAPRLLREALANPRWAGEPIMLAGVTDIYQPLEREERVTRGLLEVMAECRQPASLITKNRLVTRDLDLLAELRRFDAVHVAVSVTTLDAKLAATMEPRASSPRDRLRAIEQLAAVGVPVHVMVAPIIPGLTDKEVPAILKAASEAGATGAGYVMLRLPYQLKAMFFDWLRTHFPERAGHVESLVRATRNGELYDPRHRIRQRGEGVFADHVGGVFRVFARRFGLDRGMPALSSAHFRRPNLDGQRALFDL